MDGMNKRKIIRYTFWFRAIWSRCHRTRPSRQKMPPRKTG